MASDSKAANTQLLCCFCVIIIALWPTGAACGTATARLEPLEPPIVINTWNFTRANARAWLELEAGHSALDAIEFGCGQCEIDRCDGTVGWGGSPAETGESTLDAFIMDGDSYDVGAVGALRRVKNAIGVARLVLEQTEHTLLVGEMATKFAVEFGFKEESLSSEESREMHNKWVRNSCQPNYWKNVSPNPRTSCGPYRPLNGNDGGAKLQRRSETEGRNHYDYYFSADEQGLLAKGHDTIGMLALDSNGKFAAGTSTNGLKFKIPGRVGDSPVPGAGGYAAREAGAAAATGDGDIMMRFLLSYQAVENLRRGLSAQEAASDVIERLMNRTRSPYPEAAVIVLSKNGTFGAACTGFKSFPYVVSDSVHQVQTYETQCLSLNDLDKELPLSIHE